MLRLVQVKHSSGDRCVAVVKDDRLQRISGFDSAYALVSEAISTQRSLKDVISDQGTGDDLDYDLIYGADSDWRLLPPFDHPREPSRCLVSGTGLTHRLSADQRQSMHESGQQSQATDSMWMYRWGVEGGRPEPGKVGVQPEWFYKGPGGLLRAHGEWLEVPNYSEDGGEEPEVAGVYVIDHQGRPWRVGLTNGNEFSDHVMEKTNYLYLAPSKLRNCAVGPELVVGAEFSDLKGHVRIERAGQDFWSKAIATGESHMCHSLANLEHHHFKYAAHRRPGDAHIHFFGAGAFSFGDGIRLADGDMVEISWEGLGRPLRNFVRVHADAVSLTEVQVLRAQG